MRRIITADLAILALSMLAAGCHGAVGGSGGGAAGGAGGGSARTATGGAGGAGGAGGVSGGAGGGSTGGAGGGGVSSVVVGVQPVTASLSPGGTQPFTATVTGASNTAVTWSASGGAITATGLFTAPQTGGSYIVRATSVADSRGSGSALVTVSGGASVVEPFYDATHPYVQIMTPVPFVTYFAPATIRIWVHAPDQGADNVSGFSPAVDFYLGTTMVGTVTATTSAVDYYQLDATGVAAGSYEVIARSRLASGTVESLHIPITVIDVPPHAGPSMNLTSDVVLSGNANFELIGTPTARALLTSSNGSRIRSAAGWTGHFIIRNADVIGLGAMDVPGVEVTVGGSNALEISGSVFDRCGPPSLTANDQVPVTISGNTFQPNILTPVSSEADYAGSHPSLTIAGSSTASKLFQGNNVGVSFVRFSTSHWLIGGDHDADGNIFVGVRAGVELDSTSDITMRGNFSYHRYPFGWSQGHCVDFEVSSGTALIEHNVFRGGSWMIQGVGGEIRYNLLIDNNEAFVRLNQAGTAIHHNLLINVGFQRLYSPSGGVTLSAGSFYNNTVDAGGTMLGWFNGAFVPASSYQLTSVRNNVFTGFAYQNQTSFCEAASVAAADYNDFYNPDTTKLAHYADSGLGAHDLGGGADTNPKFAQTRMVPFPIGIGDIWLRHVTVSQILSLYRGLYTPGAGSPLIDAGSPADDTGGARNTDIGAVGAGNVHPADQFGRFGP